MRFAWNWEALLQNALTAGENRNLAIAGLVLSNDVEFAALGGETMLAEPGFDPDRSEYCVCSIRVSSDQKMLSVSRQEPSDTGRLRTRNP